MALEDSDMRIDPQRASDLVGNLRKVLDRIKAANKRGQNVRLVAVSKLKPASDIAALFDSPQRQLHFGENYAQELTEKAGLLPKEIQWHFIGALQTNKCKKLAEDIPNLWCVSSVDTAKKADALEKGRAVLASKSQDSDRLLRVMVQVNTSGEESKSGCEPHEATLLCKHIISNCPHLKLQGLMTIGAIARSEVSSADVENEDFVALREARDKVAKELGLDSEILELSMGMSSDFEAAVTQGSNEVRIGSTIFGERPPRKDANVKGEVGSSKT